MNTLSEEAQEIIYACRDSIARRHRNTVNPDGIEMLIGHKPSEQAMQELVNAGLLRVVGKDAYGDNLYYVEEQ